MSLLCFIAIHSLTRPYKRQLYNIIDIVILADMLLINLLSWYTYAKSLDTRASQDIEAAIAVKIVLMYLPLLFMGIIAIPWFLHRYGLIQKRINFLKASKEDEPIVTGTKKKKTKESCTDHDLFQRAEELNSTSLVLNSSGGEFELQTDETVVESTSSYNTDYQHYVT